MNKVQVISDHPTEAKPTGFAELEFRGILPSLQFMDTPAGRFPLSFFWDKNSQTLGVLLQHSCSREVCRVPGTQTPNASQRMRIRSPRAGSSFGKLQWDQDALGTHPTLRCQRDKDSQPLTHPQKLRHRTLSDTISFLFPLKTRGKFPVNSSHFSQIAFSLH